MSLIRGAIYGLSAAAIWGGMYVVSDIILQIIPPFSLLSLRLILGSMVLLALATWQMGGIKALVFSGKETLLLLGVGILGFGISLGAQFVGTDLSSAINGSLITSASPAFILIFATLILRERLTALTLLAVALATLGVIIIVNPASAEFSSASFAGDIALALAALTWGLYSVLVRRVSHGRDTLIVTLYALIGGLFITLPASVFELAQKPIHSDAINFAVILGILYLGVVSTAGAMWLWNRAFALVPAATA